MEGASKAFTASASLAGLSFKGQFLRLALAEPAGSYANPGRQVQGREGREHQCHAALKYATAVETPFLAKAH